MTMRKHVKGLLLCASVCSLAVGAGMISYASTTTTSSTESSSEIHTPPEDDGSVMAKIVSIDGNTLTISTADKPDHNGGQKPADGQTPPEKPADGETPPEKPADGETPPEKPADGETPPEKPADGETPPEKPADGETPPEKPTDGDNSNRPEMKFSDETTTVTLTDSTEITKGRDHASASASSLSDDDVVRIVLDGTSVVKLDIMGD